MAEIDSKYKYLTYEEMAKGVAEKALDEILYDGKSIREWMRIIASEDCISRQAVKELYYKDGYIDFRKICELPPVTPAEKVGRWISFGAQGEIDGQIVRAFTCSECGAISIFRMASGNIVNGDLCPNCGAKMQEVEE